MASFIFSGFLDEKQSVRSYPDFSECSDKLPENCFDPYLIQKIPGEDGLFFLSDETDICISDPSQITTSNAAEGYIFHLFACVREKNMTFGEFYGITSCESSLLFQYYLLLIEKFLQLFDAEEAAKGENPFRLCSLSANDDDAFLNSKALSKSLLSILTVSSFDFQNNEELLPILNNIIDLFNKVFPDSFFLAALANFTEIGFQSLRIDDVISEGAFQSSSQLSFRSKRLFQNLRSAFKHFPLYAYFNSEKLSGIFITLLTKYCGEYSPEEFHTAILNVIAFVIKSFVIQKKEIEAALEIINLILIGLRIQDENFKIILQAIIQIEKERLNHNFSSLELQLDLSEFMGKLQNFFSPEFFRNSYNDFLRRVCEKPLPEDKEILQSLTESSNIARLVFEFLYTASDILPRRTKLETVLMIFDSCVGPKISAAATSFDHYQESRRQCHDINEAYGKYIASRNEVTNTILEFFFGN